MCIVQCIILCFYICTDGDKYNYVLARYFRKNSIGKFTKNYIHDNIKEQYVYVIYGKTIAIVVVQWDCSPVVFKTVNYL